MTKYVNIYDLHNSVNQYFPTDLHNALNHTWMKDPFKAQATSTDLNITKYECSLIQFKIPFYKPFVEFGWISTIEHIHDYLKKARRTIFLFSNNISIWSHILFMYVNQNNMFQKSNAEEYTRINFPQDIKEIDKI